MPYYFWKIGFTIHACAVVMIATAAYLGILPTQYRVIPHADLIGHAVLIGALAFFADGLLRFRPLISALRFAPFVVLLIAGIEEMAQSLSPRRTASLLDFAADVGGVFIASWLARALDKKCGGRHDEV